MKKLQQLQHDFLAGLQNPQQVREILTVIVDSPQLSALDRLAIYRTSMRESLLSAIQATYPVCEKIVGADFFRAMANLFVTASPSVSADLGNYGANFAEFIASFAPAASLPYLADVAKLEWAWAQVFHGYDSTLRLDFAALAALSESQQSEIRLCLNANLRLLSSSHPIHHIWAVNQDNYDGDMTMLPIAEPVYLLIHRSKNETAMETLITELTEQEWRILTIIQQGRKLGSWQEEDLYVLPSLADKGWIADFRLT